MKRLVKKAMAGNKDAFAQLMEMNTQSMYKVARAYFTSDADVADAISETVLICFEQLDTLRKPEYFKTWMIRLAYNCWIWVSFLLLTGICDPLSINI